MMHKNATALATTPTSKPSAAKNRLRPVSGGQSWTTSGQSSNAKDAVLVFRLTALKNTGLPGTSIERRTCAIEASAADIDNAAASAASPVIVTAPQPRSVAVDAAMALRPSPTTLTSTKYPLQQQHPQRLLAPTLSLQRFGVKTLPQKRAHSLSSSDTSLSSTCDEPEQQHDATIQQPQQHDDDDRAAAAGGVVCEAKDSSMTVVPMTCGAGAAGGISTVSSDHTIVAVHTTGLPPSANGASSSSSADKENTDTQLRQQLQSLRQQRQPQVPSRLLAESPPPVNVIELPAYRQQVFYRFQGCETRLLRRLLNCHGLTEVFGDDKPFTLLWAGCHLKTETLRTLKPHQRVNHFPRSTELTRKDRLYKNIERMQQGVRGFKTFDIVPQSFMLPVEYRTLVAAHRARKTPLIVKPAASSRGRGIFLVHSPDQIPTDEQLLVSRYIANPLCIDGHKCDIRLYVAVTSFDPLLIYMYDEGLVRLATVKYDRSVENLWNPCMHLCNYSINKYHSDYIKAPAQCEDVGHKWSFSALLRHLRTQGCDTRALMLAIEDLVVKSIMACTQPIASACRMFVSHASNCFELYGYDILIDDTLKPWLLEVNMSPSLGIDTPLDTKVKASMMADLLTLVGIPAHESLRPARPGPYNPSLHSDHHRPSAAAAASAKRHHHHHHHHSHHHPPPRRSASTESGGRSGVAAGTPSSPSSPSSPQTAASSMAVLTCEERRLVANARAQYRRRGGFVRIFPAPDSMQKYGHLLDSVTGIPMSMKTPNGHGGTGAGAFHMLMPHNYNQMLFQQLFRQPAAVSAAAAAMQKAGATSAASAESVGDGGGGGGGAQRPSQAQVTRKLNDLARQLADDRMQQYEATLHADAALLLRRCCGGDDEQATAAAAACASAASLPGASDVARSRRRLLRRMIEGGMELSQLQSRRLFERYLEAVLQRLATEPSKCFQQEKLVLMFLSRSDVPSIKAPAFIRNPPQLQPHVQHQQLQQHHVISKDRSALVAKLLGDYVEIYHRESEAYVDDFDRAGTVPRKDFDEFMAVAQEGDIESVITLHTNVTRSLPFLSTRCTYGASVPPSIPTGAGGFLRALPSMVAGTMLTRDIVSIDAYYKALSDNGTSPTPDANSTPAQRAASAGGAKGAAAAATKHRISGPTNRSTSKLHRRGGDTTLASKGGMSKSATLPSQSALRSTERLSKRTVSQDVLQSYYKELNLRLPAKLENAVFYYARPSTAAAIQQNACMHAATAN